MPPKRKGLTFGQAKEEGMHRTVLDQPAPARTPPRPTETVRDARDGKQVTVRVGVTIAPADLQRVRMAYFSDLDHLKDPPPSLAQWIVRAVGLHLDRDPITRRQAVHTVHQDVLGRKQAYNATIPAPMRTALQEAVKQERRVGFSTNVSGLVRDALAVEVAAAQARAGGTLPEIEGPLNHAR